MLRNQPRCEQLSGFKGRSRGEALANEENNSAFNGIERLPQVCPLSRSLGRLWVPRVGEDGSSGRGGFALAEALMPTRVACLLPAQSWQLPVAGKMGSSIVSRSAARRSVTLEDVEMRGWGLGQ